jgi:hypothetical protein
MKQYLKIIKNIVRVLGDQPGRLLAVTVFGPIILYKSLEYNDVFLLIFAALLIIWDAWWLFFKKPQIVV